MRTQTISFSTERALSVFPDARANLAQAVAELGLERKYPVIVLIGGDIDAQHAAVTLPAIQTIAKIAEDLGALVICGGTDMGVMAKIGQMRWQNDYTFPLVGITLEEMVTWRGGPRSMWFMGLGKKRWPLAPHYSHFILVPGSDFGDESPWIVSAATILSEGQRSVTVLINGGEVSRKDIALSLESGRPVIVLSRTGRLADELAGQLELQSLISVVPADAEPQIIEAVKAALAVTKK